MLGGQVIGGYHASMPLRPRELPATIHEAAKIWAGAIVYDRLARAPNCAGKPISQLYGANGR
ncbi:MAG TPA: hypothetical protein VEI07_00915 [Planctomycetaceae bacterium]|nr:hypothetical protein [Planctomycetaceae bacterium]